MKKKMQNPKQNSIEKIEMDLQISISLEKLKAAERRGELVSFLEELSQKVKLNMLESVKKFLRQEIEIREQSENSSG